MRKLVVFLLALGSAFSMAVHAEQVLVGLDDHYNSAVFDWRDGMIEEQSFETEMSGIIIRYGSYHICLLVMKTM